MNNFTNLNGSDNKLTKLDTLLVRPGILLCTQTYVARLLRVGPIKKSYRIWARSVEGFCAQLVIWKKIICAKLMISRMCVCVRDVRHLLWYTKRLCHKMITRRYYKLFMLNKFATSSTLNNCLAKINISGSFFKTGTAFTRHCHLLITLFRQFGPRSGLTFCPDLIGVQTV